MKTLGWTHRLKGKKNSAYLKVQSDSFNGKAVGGKTYVDQEQQFHYYSADQVVEL